MALLPTEDNLINASTTNAQQKTNFANWRNFNADLLGTDSSNKAAARAALGADAALKDSEDVASATVVDISAKTQVTPRITGVVPITAWTMLEGQLSDVIFAAATPLTFDTITNNLIGGVSMTAAAGDTARIFFDGATTKWLSYTRADGSSVTPGVVVAASAAEVRARTNNTKTVTPLGLQDIIVSGTTQNTTSGTSIVFPSIPPFAKKVSIAVSKLSTSGSSNPILQLGNASGFVTSLYDAVGGISTSAPFNSVYTNGFGLTANTQWLNTDSVSGTIELTLLDAATNTWTVSGVLSNTPRSALNYLSGSISLGSGSGNALTQARITTAGGSDTFDGGTANHHAF